MKVEEVLHILEERIAPVALSDEFCAKYKMYDNSGIIINCGKSVTGAMFSLDFSEAAVDKAIGKGYNLIITHHPAIYGGISRIDITKDSKSRAIESCIRNGISVISMHLNFDVAPQGIDHYLMKGLGGESCQVCAPVTGGGYGRVYKVEPTSVKQFMKKVCAEFKTHRAVYHGDESITISKIGSFCGAGCDDTNMRFASENGCNLFVSSDLKHHEIAELVESGIGVLELTHYSAECYGFNRIYENVKESIKIPSSFFFDERFA
ncbi:MAG: Nif3-like dinuclear metal center hexameric protein [Candidatus Coproplasma sp.]